MSMVYINDTDEMVVDYKEIEIVELYNGSVIIKHKNKYILANRYSGIVYTRGTYDDCREFMYDMYNDD